MALKDFKIEDVQLFPGVTYCIATLHPWINVGNVSKLVIDRLSKNFGAKKIGELIRPSEFYDYTRYRPKIEINSDKRSVLIPNTKISLIKIDQIKTNLILLEMLEPHMFSEKFNDSIISLLKFLNVQKYLMIGSMYDSVPHTRALLVSGSVRGDTYPDIGKVNFSESTYTGPTSITSQISERINIELGISTMSLIVHLPLYLKLDNDFSGATRILNILSKIYNLDLDLPESKLGIEQYSQINPALIGNDSLKKLIAKFEVDYDEKKPSTQQNYTLSPEVENFLKEISEDYNEN
ncbi:MAG: hypothetical protein CL778_03380 [Chloroflexi bacterium]|nr:hypothetical protein [Chloroflexota bacterium]|tara:strand:+ start:13425 stop:14303 length:879 start_codon:yes stop_codon:yes gene_type:complete